MLDRLAITAAMGQWPNLSETALSNLFTMCATSRIDERQMIPTGYCIPPVPTRILRGALCAEECVFELLEGLGLAMRHKGQKIELKDVELVPEKDPDLEKIIDACCDGIYVLTGTMVVCGAPDLPHLEAVNTANNNKFPRGAPVMHPTIPGKYGKPDGWKAPNHTVVMERHAELSANLHHVGWNLVNAAKF